MVPGEAGDGPDKSNKPEKSYLSSAVDSLNLWASSSRSATPTPRDLHPGPVSAARGDHSTTHLYGQSIRSYPPDCPPLNVLWFHATDTPKRKPVQKFGKVEDKPPAVPKKFAPFSQPDSNSIEKLYQKLLEESERHPGQRQSAFFPPSSGNLGEVSIGTVGGDPTTDNSKVASKTISRVPVNEDYLFDVDIETRELEPVFWLGPVYEVRRGTWFYQEGTSLRPCDENLASQLEEGFLKVRPWLYPASKKSDDSRQPNATLESPAHGSKDGMAADSNPSAGQSNPPIHASEYAAPVTQSSPHQPQSHRLFGTYMNSVVTYQDAGTAWLSSDSMLSWVTSTVYQRFAGGGYMSGIKLVRGWTPMPTKTEEARNAAETPPRNPSVAPFSQKEARQQRMLKRRSAPPTTGTERPDYTLSETDEEPLTTPKPKVPDFMADAGTKPFADDDETFRERAEKEIRHDYSRRSGESQGREIEHLVLVTHGIGQLLSMRMESLNFVHDVNVMRKTMKSTYANSADLCALNSEATDAHNNCRVQVLPVCWRHLLDFPKKREKRNERDLGDLATEEDDYPSLEDITIEGVTFARSLVSDLALDVLLYQSAYRQLISEIVLKEANRIYHLFMDRNPNFRGKVHIIGHSLGSAIMFDILCRERERKDSGETRRNPLRFWPSQTTTDQPKEQEDLRFDFDVEDFYCLGSPVGLFQMLKGRTISARHLPDGAPSQSLFNPELGDDPFAPNSHLSPVTGLPFSVSSPKVVQLYNIFHPSDPISYRLEPLISSTMSSLKPQALPYTKKGIFGNVAPQGLSGIGTRVGQSVSGLWTSLSAGIASNILNRSLGLSNDDVARMSNAAAPSQVSGLGPATDDRDALLTASQLGERTNERKKQLADPSNHEGRASLSGNEMTLIDDELETLFTKFQEARASMVDGTDNRTNPKWLDQEPKAQKMRREELKVRALNRNGRVDYSIQESVLDFNPISTIASHLAYWADEDVNHFILSQLLSSRNRAPRK